MFGLRCQVSLSIFSPSIIYLRLGGFLFFTIFGIIYFWSDFKPVISNVREFPYIHIFKRIIPLRAYVQSHYLLYYNVTLIIQNVLHTPPPHQRAGKFIESYATTWEWSYRLILGNLLHPLRQGIISEISWINRVPQNHHYAHHM